MYYFLVPSHTFQFVRNNQLLESADVAPGRLHHLSTFIFGSSIACSFRRYSRFEFHGVLFHTDKNLVFFHYWVRGAQTTHNCFLSNRAWTYRYCSIYLQSIFTLCTDDPYILVHSSECDCSHAKNETQIPYLTNLYEVYGNQTFVIGAESDCSAFSLSNENVRGLNVIHLVSDHYINVNQLYSNLGGISSTRLL